MRLAWASLLVVTGCTSDERVAPLSDFTVFAYVDDGARITFEHFEENIDGGTCLILEEGTTASIAGVALDVVEWGGWREVGSGGKDCVFPRMEAAALPEAADATLMVGTYDCPAGDTLVPFTFTLDPVGPYHPGQTVTVSAQKPADTFGLIAQVREGPGGEPLQLGMVDSGDTLRITMPASLSGAHELVVLAKHDDSIAATMTCHGFLFTRHRAHQAIVIDP